LDAQSERHRQAQRKPHNRDEMKGDETKSLRGPISEEKKFRESRRPTAVHLGEIESWKTSRAEKGPPVLKSVRSRKEGRGHERATNPDKLLPPG